MKKNKIVEYVKKNSKVVTIVGICILVVIALLLVKDLFMFDEFTAIYGTRLNGINKYKISANQKSNAEEKIKKDVKKVKVRVSGRIVNVLVTTNNDTSLDDAKNISARVLEEFRDDQKKYYDFQFFIENDENKDQYPIMGYKHHAKNDISWTKDRTGN